MAVETLAAAVFFDDHVRDFVDALVGGEAAIAALAFAAAADGVSFFAFARVDDAILPEAAIGTFHKLSAILRYGWQGSQSVHDIPYLGREGTAN